MQITVLGMGCVIAFATPTLRTGKWRTLRTFMFIGIALSGILPVAHGIMLHGAVHCLWHMGAMWYIIEGLCYLTGALLYCVGFAFASQRREGFNAIHANTNLF